MTIPSVAVLDYGSGNVHSVCKALEAVGVSVELTNEPAKVLAADGLVVPGVGAFASVMDKLRAVRAPSLIDQRLIAGRSVLGICVGLQVMFDAGDEHGVEAEGLAEWPGRVEKLNAPRLPHIGWSRVEAPTESTLFRGLSDQYFYFVHSYAVKKWSLEVMPPFQAPAVTYAEYGERYVAAVENGPLCATQFHPEKSGEAGLALLKNWVSTFS